MTPSELMGWVTAATVAGAGVVALAALWIAGPTGALGVILGGALAALSFRALAWRVVALGRAATGGPALWFLGAGLRLLVVGAACAALFSAGWVHPVGVLTGVSLLPLAVVALGLSAARREAGS